MRLGKKYWIAGLIALLLPAGNGSPDAWAGSLRILMTDGTSVEVSYYWEEGGEVKFEVPGGVAGIPKYQVASVQEIVAAKEFDPEVLLEGTETGLDEEQRQILLNLIGSSGSFPASAEKLDPEEGIKILEQSEHGLHSTRSKERLLRPLSNIEVVFTDPVRLHGTDMVLFMTNVLSSREDLKAYRFVLTLYDGGGGVIDRKNCEVRELDADQKVVRKLGMRGRLFTVLASVKPDPKIKRYEITAFRTR